MPRIKYYLIAIFSLSFLFANAQTGKERKLARKADNLFEMAEYPDALPIYLKLLEINPTKALYNYRVGICYFDSTAEKMKSIPYFENANKYFTNKDSIPELYYYLGSSYQMMNKFEDGITSFEKLKTFIKDNKYGKRETDDIDSLIAQCKRGIDYKKSPSRAKIDNLGSNINSSYPDYAPVISADESLLIFTSKRKGNTGGKTDDNGYYYEDVYISKKVNDKWVGPEKFDTLVQVRRNFFQNLFGKAEKLTKSINTKTHDASVALSADGKKLFIFRYNSIWMSTFENDKWGTPVKLNDLVNVKNGYQPSVSLTADEKYLFVASERNGGYGGKDIYRYTKQSDGSWGQVENLGNTINTQFEEDAPFIHPDGKTLYFASTGHTTMGGYDIFKTELVDGKWSTAINIGYPVNTGADDVHFVMNKKGNRAYYASVKENTIGHLDIYAVSFEPEVNIMFAANNSDASKTYTSKIYLKGKKDTSFTIESQPINYPLAAYDNYSVKVESNGIKSHQAETTLSSDGKDHNYYGEITYEDIKDSSGKMIGQKTTFYTSTANIDSIIKVTPDYSSMNKTDAYSAITKKLATENNSGVKTVSYTDMIEVANTDLAKDTMSLRIIYFDFKDANLTEQANKDLENIFNYLSTNKNTTVEIVGHTDSKGSDILNKTLSERRAKAASQYFIAKGISKKRITTVGMGEAQPATQNENTDGSDNPDGRQKNRRVEFKFRSNVK